MARTEVRSLGTAFILVFLNGCQDPAPPRIGVVMGSEGLAGARFAAAEINATNGIHGRPLVLRAIGERGPEARDAIVAAESLSTDPAVIGVVGHSNSGSSLAASQIYNDRKVVQISPTSSAVSLTDAGPYTFRVVASDMHQARFLADEILKAEVKPRPAVVYVNDDYGRSLREEIHSRLASSQVAVAFQLPYAEGVPLTDVDGVVRAISNAGAKQLIWLGRAPQLRQLLPSLRRSIPDLRVFATDAIDTRETAANVGGVLTGVRFVCFVDVHGSRPEIASLRDRYRAKTGATLTAEMALTYDAVMLIATAARDAGVSRRAVHRYVTSLGNGRPPYVGATGDIAFDSSGDPRPSYCLSEVTSEGVRVLRKSDAQ